MIKRKYIVYSGIVFIVFLLILISSVLVIKSAVFAEFFKNNEIVRLANSGKNDLQVSQAFVITGDYEQAGQTLKDADNKFGEALNELASFDLFYTRMIPYTPTNSIEKILQSAQEATKVLSYLNHALWTIMTEKNIGKSLVSIENAIFSIEQIEKDLNSVNHLFLPAKIRAQFEEIETILLNTANYRKFLANNINTLNEFFGKSDARTYAVFFQNTAEARANGGFIGSMLLFTTQGGKIVSYELKDTQLMGFNSGFYFPAPKYYQYIPRIDLKEINYTPDIRVTAEMAISLLEKSGGPTVSAVFFIDDKILPFILSKTGPLLVSGFNSEISADNYFELLQYDLEWRNVLATERIKNPKENFFNLVSAVFKKMLTIKFDKSTLDSLSQFIAGKHIQAYSRDESLQTLFDDLNLSGHFPELNDNEDFLAIVHSTFFNKSNRFMEDKVVHNTFVDSNNNLSDLLILKRKHTYREELSSQILKTVGLENQPEAVKNKFLDIIGKGENLDLVRIYVPKGAVLKKSSGINLSEIYQGEELGKSFFAFSLEIATAEEREITLEYSLPSKFSDQYNLYVWKQPGSADYEFKKEFNYLEENSKTNLKATLSNQLDNDYYIEAKLNKFLWINQLEMKEQKIKSQLKSKMKLDLGFIPML